MATIPVADPRGVDSTILFVAGFADGEADLHRVILALTERNLFTAHEVAQAIELSSGPWGAVFREANRWTDAYLPNAREGRIAERPANVRFFIRALIGG